MNNKTIKHSIFAAIFVAITAIYLLMTPNNVSAVTQVLGLRDKENQENICSAQQVNEGFTNHDIFNYDCCYQKADTPPNKCLAVKENAGLVPFRGEIKQPNGEPFSGVKLRLDVYRYQKSGEAACSQMPGSAAGYSQCCYKDPAISEANVCKQGKEFTTVSGDNYGVKGSYDFRDDNFVCAQQLGDDAIVDTKTNQKRALYYLYYTLETGNNPNYKLLKSGEQTISSGSNQTAVLGEESGLTCKRVQGPDKTEIINNILQTTPTFVEKCECPPGQQYNETTKKCEPKPSDTPTPPPVACNSTCDPTNSDRDCEGAKDGCTSCNPNSKKCEPPPAGCQVGCSEDKDCNSEPQKQAGCTVCRPDSTGKKTCQPQISCNDSCRVDRPEDCRGAAPKNGESCTVCVPNQVGSNIGTCQAPSKLNCKCDQMDLAPIFIGSPINVTAYYKFYNGDLSGVKLPKIKFALYECSSKNGPCNKKLEEAEVVPQLVETSQSQVRYKGTWKFTPKEKLKVNTNYKIYLVSTPRRTPSSCSESTQASNYEQIMNLADSFIPTAHAQEESATTTDSNPLQQVISWFSGLFGDSSTPIQNPSNTADTDTTKEIQLTTLSPATITNKGCYDYRFIIKQ